MESSPGQHLGRSLRSILAPLPVGASIRDLEEFQPVLRALEFFTFNVLADRHPGWEQGEGFDGILPLVARKAGDREAEVFGLCILISDQTTTPIHLRLQVSAARDAVSRLKWRVGEAGEHGMARSKWTAATPTKRLYALEGREDEIEWAYRATFGREKM